MTEAEADWMYAAFPYCTVTMSAYADWLREVGREDEADATQTLAEFGKIGERHCQEIWPNRSDDFQSGDETDWQRRVTQWMADRAANQIDSRFWMVGRQWGGYWWPGCYEYYPLVDRSAATLRRVHQSVIPESWFDAALAAAEADELISKPEWDGFGFRTYLVQTWVAADPATRADWVRELAEINAAVADADTVAE